MNQALAHRDHFRSRPLDTNLETEWRRLAEESLAQQRAVEAEAEMPFEAYLRPISGAEPREPDHN